MKAKLCHLKMLLLPLIDSEEKDLQRFELYYKQFHMKNYRRLRILLYR
jgi:hypothetical protein